MFGEIGKQLIQYSLSESAKNLGSGDSVPKAIAKGVGSGILSLLLCLAIVVGIFVLFIAIIAGI